MEDKLAEMKEMSGHNLTFKISICHYEQYWNRADRYSG